MNILLELLQVLHSCLFSDELLICIHYSNHFFDAQVENLKKKRCNLGATVIMNVPLLADCLHAIPTQQRFLLRKNVLLLFGTYELGAIRVLGGITLQQLPLFQSA